MTKKSVEGVVVKVSVTGESDRIIWLLTRTDGIIHAFAKGARGVRSKLHGAASMFAYGTFWLTASKDTYNVTDAEIKERFFDLRNDLTALTLAQYFCEAAVKCVADSGDNPENIRLLLNSLHFLAKGTKDPLYIKSVFELRLSSLLGYAPKLVACDVCGEFETPYMYFDCSAGALFCGKCGNPALYPRLDAETVRAMRHIVFSEFDRIFSFDCATLDLPALNRVTEQYFLNCVQLRFDTLDFYHR